MLRKQLDEVGSKKCWTTFLSSASKHNVLFDENSKKHFLYLLLTKTDIKLNKKEIILQEGHKKGHYNGLVSSLNDQNASGRIIEKLGTALPKNQEKFANCFEANPFMQ